MGSNAGGNRLAALIFWVYSNQPTLAKKTGSLVFRKAAFLDLTAVDRLLLISLQPK